MRQNASRPTRIEALEAFITRYLPEGKSALDSALMAINALLSANTVESPRLASGFTVKLSVDAGVFSGARAAYEQTHRRDLVEDLRASLQVWLNLSYALPGEPFIDFQVNALHEGGFDAEFAYDYLSRC